MFSFVSRFVFVFFPAAVLKYLVFVLGLSRVGLVLKLFSGVAVGEGC